MHAAKCKQAKDAGPCDCDGYHTFEELYEHRYALYLALCRNWAGDGCVWRSRRHSDGTSYDGMFLLGIGVSPGEQITYHLPVSLWGMAWFAHTLEGAPDYDGHTSDDVICRVMDMASEKGR